MPSANAAGDNAAPLFLHLREVARRTGLSKATISRMIAAGKIPCVRLSKWPLVPAAWLDSLAERAARTVSVEEAAK